MLNRRHASKEKWQRGELRQAQNRGKTLWYGRWRVYGKRGGKRMSMRLGDASKMTEAEAREVLDRLIQSTNEAAGYMGKIGAVSILEYEAEAPKPGQRGSAGRGGVLAELIVAADLLSKGFEVYRPLNPQSFCDLVIAHEDKFLRIEVKRGYSADVKRNLGKFDVLAMYGDDGKVRYYSKFDALGFGERVTCVPTGCTGLETMC